MSSKNLKKFIIQSSEKSFEVMIAKQNQSLIKILTIIICLIFHLAQFTPFQSHQQSVSPFTSRTTQKQLHLLAFCLTMFYSIPRQQLNFFLFITQRI